MLKNFFRKRYFPYRKMRYMKMSPSQKAKKPYGDFRENMLLFMVYISSTTLMLKMILG
jgi:hypothetical protein